ncbi:unnamed protein product, partial [Rotaria sp. Silwood2]
GESANWQKLPIPWKSQKSHGNPMEILELINVNM